MTKDVNLSGRQLWKILRIIRLKYGKSAIEPKVREALVTQKKMFSDLFEKAYIEDFEDRKGEPISRLVTYCTCGCLQITESFD